MAKLELQIDEQLLEKVQAIAVGQKHNPCMDKALFDSDRIPGTSYVVFKARLKNSDIQTFHQLRA